MSKACLPVRVIFYSIRLWNPIYFQWNSGSKDSRSLILRFVAERFKKMNDRTRLICSVLTALPFLSAIGAIGWVKDIPPAIRTNPLEYLNLSILHLVLFCTVFYLANIIATFSVSSVPTNKLQHVWYIVRQSIRSAVSMFGVALFFAGGIKGQLEASPWLWANLGSTVIFVLASLSDFPDDDNLLDRARRLGA